MIDTGLYSGFIASLLVYTNIPLFGYNKQQVRMKRNTQQDDNSCDDKV